MRLCCAKTQMLMPPKIATAFKAAREPVTSILVVATMAAVAFAAGGALRPAKRVGSIGNIVNSCRATSKSQSFLSLPEGLSGMLSRRHDEFRVSKT